MTDMKTEHSKYKQKHTSETERQNITHRNIHHKLKQDTSV